ncbi:MAG: T9SS type A sorting domain-containing protein [Ignavibacteria bacterium]|nr:T9SS type A sorting domain-containing protein [Ignavibacteria bacterium]MBT8393027.1 T9SS type A sorting domain-containing protein [Ignavibacteria bacterium]NNL22291.1 T9SS type A sorting domain-containing protein [Ignavibacteriaceae bacterium]
MKNSIFVIIVSLLLNINNYSQSFTQIEANLKPMRYASIDWGDYDNDGDLDILTSGSKFVGDTANFNNSDPATIIYRNDGNDQFTLVDSSITGTESGTALWGDYNNDSSLDILISGRVEINIGYSAVTEIWEKDSAGTFYKSIILDSLDYPNASWADINNDGFLDIFLSGDQDLSFPDLDPVSILFTNDQNGGFTRDDTSITGITYGGSEFADYDNDGDFDLIITGLELSNGYITVLYENQNGQFVQNPSNFLGVLRSKIAWADVDNDGDVDFVVGGQEGGIAATRTKLYRNDAGSFVEIPLPDSVLAQVSLPSFDWGDYDNDGDVDLLLSGQIGILATRITSILRNEGNFEFTALNDELVPVRTGDAKWADYDNDGDLDIAICGTDTSNTFGEYITRIYKNNLNVPNNAPTKPIISNAFVNGSDVLCEWIVSSDDHTPQSSLTYNLRIGTAPGGSDILNPMADENNGFRKLLALGNTNFKSSWEILNLEDGNYYWAVQAIDGAMAGSEFSNEGTFTVGSVTSSRNESLPQEYKLEQNFPNPFNPSTTIEYSIKEKSPVLLIVYNALGKRVITLVNKLQPAGNYKINFEASSLPSGIYFFKLSAGGFSETKKMILLK